MNIGSTVKFKVSKYTYNCCTHRLHTLFMFSGWMVKLEVSDPDEFAKLMTFKEYKKTYEE